MLPKDAARLVEKLARGMEAAHQEDVIHRDLKPANVLLSLLSSEGEGSGVRGFGTPKITDFGLAQKLDDAGQTQSGAIMGTPSYMAPEQAGDKTKKMGPATDIYALGAILYDVLTGRPAFKAATTLDTILQVVGEDPVPPSQLQHKTPRDLETICLKCLQKDPAKRYATAEALADDLGRYQDGEPIHARPVGNAERVTKWVKRRPTVAGCNLWSGREEDRAGAVCDFCDTDFVGTDGPGGGHFPTAQGLADAIDAMWPSNGKGKKFVVCTGGEPLLQMTEEFVRALHERSFEVAIETNGTKLPPPGIDWICVSPKANAELVLQQGHELKLIYPQNGAEPERYEHLDFGHFYLQPMDGPERVRNTQLAVRYCLEHPRWRLSLQTQKVLGIK